MEDFGKLYLMCSQVQYSNYDGVLERIGELIDTYNTQKKESCMELHEKMRLQSDCIGKLVDLVDKSFIPRERPKLGERPDFSKK